MVCRMGIHPPFGYYIITLFFGRKVWYNER